MAIVNALRFDAHSGAMVVDEESWHLRRRKTFFTVNLFEIAPPPGARDGVWAGYGAVGDPHYHHEVMGRVRKSLGTAAPDTVEGLGRVVLDASHGVSRRIVDDRLRMLFGFTADDLTRGYVEDGEEKAELKNPAILKRAREIVEGKEKPAGRDLIPPNQACLMGVDPGEGFQMFCLKEADGVLSFNAGGFESLGQGRYAGGMHLTGALGERTLRERREGMDRAEGMRLLLESVLEAADHFGQVGGHLHILVLDDRLSPPARLRRLDPGRALLATETVRAARADFLDDGQSLALLEEIVFEGKGLDRAEKRLFEEASDAEKLELHLRGYKSEATRP